MHVQVVGLELRESIEEGLERVRVGLRLGDVTPLAGRRLLAVFQAENRQQEKRTERVNFTYYWVGQRQRQVGSG